MLHKTKVIPLEEVFKVVRNKEPLKGKHIFQIMTSKKVILLEQTPWMRQKSG